MRIDNSYLSRFPEFIQFRARTREPGMTVSLEHAEALPIATQTPDELLRSTVKQIESALRKELLRRILAAPSAFFKSVVVAILIGMGYGGSREEAGRIVGRSGDGVIDQDALGLDRVYVQAKRYASDNPVGAPEIMGFCGSLGPKKAAKGVFVTTSFFTQPAKDFAERPSVQDRVDRRGTPHGADGTPQCRRSRG